MPLETGNPFVRYNDAGPFGVGGKAWVAKLVSIRFRVTAAGNFDIITIPAGSWITRVWGHIAVALNGTLPTIDFGTDGDPDAFLDAADWVESDLDAVTTNVGSANASAPTGLYFPAADILRVTVGGSPAPTLGTVDILMEMFDKAAVFGSKTHYFI